MLFRTILILAGSFLLLNLAQAETEKEKWHIEHPDHIPHEQSWHGKNPVKKVFDDDLSFMRKKKKKAYIVTHENI